MEEIQAFYYEKKKKRKQQIKPKGKKRPLFLKSEFLLTV